MGLYNRVVAQETKTSSAPHRADSSVESSVDLAAAEHDTAFVHSDEQFNDEEKKKPSTIF